MTDRRCGCNHLSTQHLLGPCAECRCAGWHETDELVECMINGRWSLMLPEHRAYRRSWPWFEAARLSAMHDELEAGDVIYDIGAEEGDLSALWASWGCDVVLIEPNPIAWPNIRLIFGANYLTGHIVGWWDGLLSDEPRGSASIGRPGAWPQSAFGPLVADHGFHHLAEHHDPTITLDSLVFGLDQAPDAITIDVEGGELHVLRGAERTLVDHRPKVWVSVHPEFMRDRYDQDAADLYDFMAGLGYERHFLAIDHEHHEMFLPA